MILVIDASVALKAFFPEDDTERARALLDKSDERFAPDLIVAEACNAVWLKVRAGNLEAGLASDILDRIPGLFDALTPSSRLARDALSLAVSLGHPAYDCFYLALAQRLGAPLITADRRLIRAVTGTSLENGVTTLTGLET